MRTCFVPFCDSKNKDQPNRTMFLVPKEQTLFAQWAEVLPKVRSLRSTDRVCHLHFKPEDVVYTFDHCINGQIFKIQRDRPKLKPFALPCLEITTKEELLSYRIKNRASNHCKEIKNTGHTEPDQTYDLIIEDPKQIENESLINNANIQNEKPQVENCTLIVNFEEESNETIELPEQRTNNELESQLIELVTDENSYECEKMPDLLYSTISQDLTSKHLIDLFNLIYDKAYEVLIPNPLWGIHRCANRSLICFSYMDITRLQVTKMVTIFDDASVQLVFQGTLIKILHLLRDIIDLDSLSMVLSEVDKWRLCFGRETNTECEIVVDSSNDNCWSTEENEQMFLCKLCLQLS